MPKYYTLVCRNCGKVMRKKRANVLYCDKCKKLMRKKSKREYMDRNKKSLQSDIKIGFKKYYTINDLQNMQSIAGNFAEVATEILKGESKII